MPKAKCLSLQTVLLLLLLPCDGQRREQQRTLFLPAAQRHAQTACATPSPSPFPCASQTVQTSWLARCVCALIWCVYGQALTTVASASVARVGRICVGIFACQHGNTNISCTLVLLRASVDGVDNGCVSLWVCVGVRRCTRERVCVAVGMLANTFLAR